MIHSTNLTDSQINDIYKGIDPIIVQNKAARMGMDSDYAMRIAFGRAIEATLAPMWISCDVELPEDDQVVNILYWPYDNHEN